MEIYLHRSKCSSNHQDSVAHWMCLNNYCCVFLQKMGEKFATVFKLIYKSQCSYNSLLLNRFVVLSSSIYIYIYFFNLCYTIKKYISKRRFLQQCHRNHLEFPKNTLNKQLVFFFNRNNFFHYKLNCYVLERFHALLRIKVLLWHCWNTVLCSV